MDKKIRNKRFARLGGILFLLISAVSLLAGLYPAAFLWFAIGALSLWIGFFQKKTSEDRDRSSS